jgi:short-subunit dehydrogenase
MNQKANKLAVITGASAGIGKAFAYELHNQGYNVHLVARRETNLLDICEQLNTRRINSASYAVLDLLDSDQCKELELYLSSNEVSLLVNNVGRGSYGYFEQLSRGQENDMVTLNVDVPLRLAHAVIPGLKARRSGGIIFVSSIAAFQPLPYMATYSATKAFNLHQALALRHELMEFNVNVTAVCPGPVDTEFGGVARVPGTVTGISRDTAELVAKESYKAYKNKNAIIVPGFSAKFYALASRVLPYWLTIKIVSKLISPRILLKNGDGPI